MLRSEEFPGHNIRSMPWRENTGSWCLEAWAGAVSSCKIISDYLLSLFFSLHSLTNGISLGRKITFWYRHQSMSPFPSFRTSFSWSSSHFHTGFLSGIFWVESLFIPLVISQLVFSTASSSLFICWSLILASVFSAFVSFSQQWHGPFQSYEKLPQNMNSCAPAHRARTIDFTGFLPSLIVRHTLTAPRRWFRTTAVLSV